jgi:hypothetical protein
VSVRVAAALALLTHARGQTQIERKFDLLLAELARLSQELSLLNPSATYRRWRIFD